MIYTLTGKIQHYQWGGSSFIPQLLQQQNAAQQPCAEYWLGAHVNAPSLVNNTTPLTVFFEQDAAALGQKVMHDFKRLPYLLKVLDVKDMLSIQVHPSKENAVKAFAAENEKGVPLNAPHRNYKDDNHKPELMAALSEFYLLHGFRPAKKLVALLQAIPELNFLEPVFVQGGYKKLYETVMLMDTAMVTEKLQPLLDRIIPLYYAGKLEKTHPDFWAARAAITYNEAGKTDRGIFSVYLLNLVRLQPGEGIFQDAGILHAYLEGQNIEIMANSDNVLRGGLTPKHVDVPELMQHVSFTATEPVIVNAKPVTANEKVYKTPAPDFELSTIKLATGQSTTISTSNATILLATEGSVVVTEAGAILTISAGQAFLATANSQFLIHANASAVLYRAAVPVA